MDFLQNAGSLTSILIAITAVIGALTMVVEGLIGLAKLTSTKKDDAILNKVSIVLNKTAGMLDKVTPVTRKPPEDV
jgi:hypothetical protein|tara:strand:+ start:484 stop:711 length:228 start_codon:yes stop_codon:yes gene_type:complete